MARFTRLPSVFKHRLISKLSRSQKDLQNFMHRALSLGLLVLRFRLLQPFSNPPPSFKPTPAVFPALMPHRSHQQNPPLSSLVQGQLPSSAFSELKLFTEHLVRVLVGQELGTTEREQPLSSWHFGAVGSFKATVTGRVYELLRKAMVNRSRYAVHPLSVGEEAWEWNTKVSSGSGEGEHNGIHLSVRKGESGKFDSILIEQERIKPSQSEIRAAGEELFEILHLQGNDFTVEEEHLHGQGLLPQFIIFVNNDVQRRISNLIYLVGDAAPSTKHTYSWAPLSWHLRGSGFDCIVTFKPHQFPTTQTHSHQQGSQINAQPSSRAQASGTVVRPADVGGGPMRRHEWTGEGEGTSSRGDHYHPYSLNNGRGSSHRRNGVHSNLSSSHEVFTRTGYPQFKLPTPSGTSHTPIANESDSQSDRLSAINPHVLQVPPVPGFFGEQPIASTSHQVYESWGHFPDLNLSSYPVHHDITKRDINNWHDRNSSKQWEDQDGEIVDPFKNAQSNSTRGGHPRELGKFRQGGGRRRRVVEEVDTDSQTDSG